MLCRLCDLYVFNRVCAVLIGKVSIAYGAVPVLKITVGNTGCLKFFSILRTVRCLEYPVLIGEILRAVCVSKVLSAALTEPALDVTVLGTGVRNVFNVDARVGVAGCLIDDVMTDGTNFFNVIGRGTA